MPAYIINEQTKFFSTKITEEFVWKLKVLFWTAIAVLASAVFILFLGLFFYIIKV